MRNQFGWHSCRSRWLVAFFSYRSLVVHQRPKPRDEINEVARATSTDLIAIATRGYTGLKARLFGKHDGTRRAEHTLPGSGGPR